MKLSNLSSLEVELSDILLHLTQELPQNPVNIYLHVDGDVGELFTKETMDASLIKEGNDTFLLYTFTSPYASPVYAYDDVEELANVIHFFGKELVDIVKREYSIPTVTMNDIYEYVNEMFIEEVSEHYKNKIAPTLYNYGAWALNIFTEFEKKIAKNS